MVQTWEPFKVNLVGQRFGRLVVMSFSHTAARRRKYWLCQCDCGGAMICLSDGLKGGKYTGCSACRPARRAKERTTHGGMAAGNSKRLYNIWTLMKRRCHDPKDPNYARYGIKGIRVCEQWHKFAPFQEWAHSNGYTEELTIDRKNSHADYSPDNCQWLTLRENSLRACEVRRLNYLYRRMAVVGLDLYG